VGEFDVQQSPGKPVLQHFHGGNRGSNPRGDATLIRNGSIPLILCDICLVQYWFNIGSNRKIGETDTNPAKKYSHFDSFCGL